MRRALPVRYAYSDASKDKMVFYFHEIFNCSANFEILISKFNFSKIDYLFEEFS